MPSIVPMLALLSLSSLASPARAQHRDRRFDLDPATMSVLGDPVRRRIRLAEVQSSIVEAELQLAGLPDRTPGHVLVGTGLALAVGGLFAVLAGVLMGPLREGLSCTFTLGFCAEPSRNDWIVPAAIGGAVALVAGLALLAGGGALLSEIGHRARPIARRLEGRRRELELLRAVELQAAPGSFVVIVSGGF